MVVCTKLINFDDVEFPDPLLLWVKGQALQSEHDHSKKI